MCVVNVIMVNAS